MASGNGTGSLSQLTSFAINLAQNAGQPGGFSRALGNAVVQEAVFDSNFNPPLAFQPFAPGDPGAPQEPQPGLMQYVRPRITLKMGVGPDIVFAPWGAPVGSPYPNLAGLGFGVASLTALVLGHKKTAVTLAFLSAAGFGLGYVQQKGAA